MSDVYRDALLEVEYEPLSMPSHAIFPEHTAGTQSYLAGVTAGTGPHLSFRNRRGKLEAFSSVQCHHLDRIRYLEVQDPSVAPEQVLVMTAPEHLWQQFVATASQGRSWWAPLYT